MSQNQLIRFTLNISADQFLNVYRGSARKISALAADGRRIEFPASNIQSYLSRNGIQGQFEMELTPANKFIAIRKMSR